MIFWWLKLREKNKSHFEKRMINLTEQKRQKELKLLKKIVVAVSGLLLLVSLTQNIYYVEGMKSSLGSFGAVAFLLGWFGLYGAGISWLANPLLFFSWISIFSNIKRAKIFGLLAMLFSLSFLLFDEIVANEGGTKSKIVAYGIGYWFWIGSTITNFFGVLFIEKIQRR